MDDGTGDGKPTLYEPRRGLALWDAEEEQAVLRVLRSRSPFRYYGPDPQGRVDAFERDFAASLGVRHAVAVSSGTAALTCALIGLGIGEGDEVIVPAVTFVGCVNAVVAARGVPVFAEVDESLTLDPDRLAERLTERTFAVMPVHLANAAADMDRLRAVTSSRGVRLVEDAAQAAGVRYHDVPAGALGDVGAFSFQADKNLTAGEGGAVVTDDDGVADRVRRYQDQGGQFTTSGAGVRGGEGEPVLGTNLRMTEMAGALLGVQLGRLPGMVAHLRASAATIRSRVGGSDVPWRPVPDLAGSAGDVTFYLPSRLEARSAVTWLRDQGVPAATLYAGQPVYAGAAVRAGRTPWGRLWDRVERCRTSEGLLGRSVTVSLGARMSDEDAEVVATAIRGVLTP